jgi:heat shock protein HtpX
MNYIKTAARLAALTCMLVLIGGLAGGQKGALLAPLVAGAMNFVAGNPFSGGGVARFFSTHPPVAERIRRLELLAGGP